MNMNGFSGGGGFSAKIFGEPKGSGYAAKTDVVTQSPLTCPKCGKPCAGTAERKTCASCGLSSVAQETTKTPVLGKVDNPCPTCGAPLTIIGDIKRCNACKWSL